MSKQAEYLKKRGWVMGQRKKRGCLIQVWWRHPDKAGNESVPQHWAIGYEQQMARLRKGTP